MSLSPRVAFLLSLALFLGVLLAVGVVWAFAGDHVALILGIAVFVLFYAIIVLLYRRIRAS